MAQAKRELTDPRVQGQHPVTDQASTPAPSRSLHVVPDDTSTAGAKTKSAAGTRTPMTAEQRSLRARTGAYALHAKYDSRDLTAKARKTFLDRFEKEVDPEGRLPLGERARRAEHARKAHFSKLAMKSAAVRKRRAQGKP